MRHVVEVLGLGEPAIVPRAPAGVVEVLVEPARARVAREAHAGGVVPRAAQDFGQSLDLGGQPAAVAQGNHLGAKAIAPGEHGGVGGRGGDVRGVVALKERALFGEGIDVRGGLPVVAVATHVIRQQRIDGDEEDVGFGGLACLRGSMGVPWVS